MTAGVTESIPCPGCGYENRPGVLICNMCSQVLRRRDEKAAAESAPVTGPGPEHRPEHRPGGFDLFAPPEDSAQTDRSAGLAEVTASAESMLDAARPGRSPYARPGSETAEKNWMKPVFTAKSWKYHLGVGFVLALFFSLPIHIARSIGWFFSSLVHEMGHTLISYYLGSIALPALRLDGHAATVHFDQAIWLALLIWAALGAGAAYFWLARRKPVAFTLAAAALSYPLLAFTDFREIMFLVGGHGGELVLATIFFWRAGVISHKVREEERTLYAALAFYLWFQNIVLHWSLMFSEASRDWYLNSGSFGLENDFVRIADEMHLSIPALSFTMLLITLAVPPVGLAWAHWSMRGHMKAQASSWDD